MSPVIPENLAARLRAEAEARAPQALAWLRELVAANSFTANPAGVAEQARLTAAGFVGLGFVAEMVPALNPAHGPHLFLRRRSPSLPADTRPVVLVTHLDTVFPPEEEALQAFHWREAPEEDRIYGPGTVDNKGGTVLIWLMLEVLRAGAPAGFEGVDFLIAANAAEEVIGSDFADRVRERCPQGARAVLVFEGGPVEEGRHHLVTARKGRLEYRLACFGRAAHAGSAHQDGINAVLGLASVLPKVAALADPERELSVNVASMQGGTVLNRVPHHATAELEMRAYDPGVLDVAEHALLALAGELENGARLQVTCLGRTPPWPGGAGSGGLLAHWEAAAAALDLMIVEKKRGGLSDANYLRDLGPTLDALGPFGGNAHCSEWDPALGKVPEYAHPSSFAPKAALNALALARLLWSPPGERPLT